MAIFILLAMIFCHIVDDYYLQGILAKLKQKDWWEKHAPDCLYKYDYIIGLVMHAASWAFMIMLPIAIYLSFAVGWVFVLVFVANLIIHAVVDDLKANKKAINLIQDQMLHVSQIIITFTLIYFM